MLGEYLWIRLRLGLLQRLRLRLPRGRRACWRLHLLLGLCLPQPPGLRLLLPRHQVLWGGLCLCLLLQLWLHPGLRWRHPWLSLRLHLGLDLQNPWLESGLHPGFHWLGQ